MKFKSLFAIAEELAELAKRNVPKIRDGEIINREWLENGVYYRETTFNGDVYQAEFDFRNRIGKFSQIRLLK